MPDPVYTFGIEFVTGSFTDVTTRVERGSWGSTIVDMLRQPAVGHGLFELHNQDGTMSPRNNTNMRPGKAVKLTATHAGSSYPLFFGRLTDISASSRLGERTALLECVDDWDRVSRVRYTTGLHFETNIASLFTVLMSLSKVNSFSADTLVDKTGFAWYQDRDAISALHDLVKSGNYQLVVDGNGTYYLRDRYWQAFASAVNTYSVADEVRVRLGQESVVNQMKMTGVTRKMSSNVTTLAFLIDPIFIPGSSGIGFFLTFQDPNEPSAAVPVTSLVAQVSSQDYYGATNSDGSGADLTANLSSQLTSFASTAVASIFNGNATPAWLTRFQIRGFPTVRVPTIGTQYEVASSQTQFGVKELTIDSALVQNQFFMDSLSRTVVQGCKDGIAVLKLGLANEFPDVLDNLNGDIVSVVDAFGGNTTQWRIRGVSHDLELVQGLRHGVAYDMETFENAPWLVLDHATFGQLDNERLLAV